MEIIKIIYDLICDNHSNLRHPRSIKVLFFVLFFLISSLSTAQIISRIEISGIKIFSEKEYLGWMKISAGARIFAGIEDSIKIRIGAGLRENGFFNYSFDTISLLKTDSLKSVLRIGVTEGEAALIKKIDFIDQIPDSIQIAAITSSAENTPLANSNVESLFSRILDYYENTGFPFASVTIESVEFGNDSAGNNSIAVLHLSLKAGIKSKIDRIEIDGNEKTKDYVITRAIRIKKGEEYSQKKIEFIPEQLNRLRFFEPIENPSFYFTKNNEGVLRISLKEKQTNLFDGILGYVPAANDKEKGYLTGFVNVTLRNLFGSGRAASFRWQQETKSSQELELHYLEPWLFDYPFNIEGKLFQRKQDSTYIQRDLEARLEYIATEEISASVILSTQSTIPSENSLNRFTVYNSTSLTSGINLKIDTRDDFYAPTGGIYFNNTYKYTSKKIDGPAGYITSGTKTETAQQRLEFDLSIFQRIFSRQILAFGVHGRELRGDDIEFSDLYFLGGTNTLRGYREKQFQGNRMLWSNLEYRLLLSNRSFTFLFFDGGYFLRNGDEKKNIPENSAFKSGYGFGLSIETGLGVLSVSFALAKGDSFGDGKIHFGIINEF